MKLRTLMIAVAAAGLVFAVEAQDKVQVKITLPKPQFTGTPKEIKNAENLEPPRDGKPYDPIMVPVGCDKLLSVDCKGCFFIQYLYFR